MSMPGIGGPPPLPLGMQLAQNSHETPVGKPNLTFRVGAGKNIVNCTAGVGAKIWESPNGAHSVGVGASASQNVARFQGKTYTPTPNCTAGVSYRWKF